VEHIAEIDRLENHPDWYRRQKITVELITSTHDAPDEVKEEEVFIYILENAVDIIEMKSKSGQFCEVIHGNWRRFLIENGRL